ncbi:MAG: mechanosensitive ion channel domain-containing protein [Verrucomicrobiota bacterium]
MDILQKLGEQFRVFWNLELYKSGSTEIFMSQLIIALVVTVIGLSIAKRLSHLIANRIGKVAKLSDNTIHLIQRLTFYFIDILVILIALPIAGIPITIFAVMGSAFAIGIGFGAQNLFRNLISGFIIMFEKPIRIGDIVEIDEIEGRVQEIGNRTIVVKRSDGVDLVVPNHYFIDQIVVNWTREDGAVRATLPLGVAYGSPVTVVRDLLLKIANDNERVLQDPRPPEVLFSDFGDNALGFELHFWSNIVRPMDRRRVMSELRFEIDRLFNEAGIVISFPQRDVHLDTIKPLEVKMIRE